MPAEEFFYCHHSMSGTFCPQRCGVILQELSSKDNYGLAPKKGFQLSLSELVILFKI